MATVAARVEARLKLLCLGLGTVEPDFDDARTSRRDLPLADDGRSGVLLADAAGRLLHASAEGRRLLVLASQQRACPEAAPGDVAALPAAVASLCRSLARVVAGEARAAAPVCRRRNARGTFSFRAHWLEAVGAAPALVGIVVSHEEPAPLRMMRAVADLPLSSRQAQVCFLLARGATYGGIARELGISRHTAVAHGRWIYDRLDVHNRAELVGRLLVGAAPGGRAADPPGGPFSGSP